jgi:hypothetical protein
MCVPAPPAPLPLPSAVVVRVAEQQSKAQMQADGKEFGQDGVLVALGEGLDLLLGRTTLCDATTTAVRSSRAATLI